MGLDYVLIIEGKVLLIKKSSTLSVYSLVIFCPYVKNKGEI